MPYDAQEDKYHWGVNFKRDGSDWKQDPNYSHPKLSDAVRVLKNSGSTTFEMLITGKLYKGRSKISGATTVVDLLSLQFASRAIAKGGRAVPHGGGYGSLEQKLTDLLGIDKPEEITYIEFRPLD